MAISRSFSLFLLFSLTLAESDHLIWEPSECDFVNSNSQCINCKIKEAHQGTFPPKTSDAPKKPTKVQVFLYYPENATNEREDLASGLRFLIQHPNDTDRLAGYQIFTDFRTHLDGNVQISTPVKTDVKFDVIYPEDAQIMVDLPLTSMYETYGEEDPYFWLDRKLEVHVCSMPAPRKEGISNCIKEKERPHIRLLPNFKQPTEPVAERCTALEVDDDVSTGQSVNIFVAGTVLIGLIVLLTIMLFCLRNKIPLVKTIWKGDRGESEKESGDFDPVIGMWESAQALDKMLSISQPADFSRSDHNMSVAPSDSRSCVNSQSGYDIRSYGFMNGGNHMNV